MSRTYRLPETIQTDRYLLRRVTPADAAAIFASYATDAAVTRHLGWRPHVHVNETTAFLEHASREWDDGAGYPLVVFPRATPDRLIGMFHPHVRGFVINYGYVLCSEAWGKGCATEILCRLVVHALSDPTIYRAEAFCDWENPASARVMQKAGMTFEGILRRYFLHPNLADVPRDCLMYSKVR